MFLRPPKAPSTSIQRGRDDELFEWADVGRGLHHCGQQTGAELLARTQGVFANRHTDGVGMVPHPGGNALRLERADALDAASPAQPQPVDPFGQLGQREDVGRGQERGELRTQPGGHGVAGRRVLRGHLLQPSQGRQLPV